MPPKVKTTPEDILNAAYEIVRESGMEKLTSRNVAARLGTSVQPIFRSFETMEDLEHQVMEKIKDAYRQFLMQSVTEEDGLLGMVFAYIKFAREEKKLFQVLHMSERYSFQKMEEISQEDVNAYIVQNIAKMEQITTEQAAFVYRALFFTIHGIASMIATNQCEFQDEEIKNMIAKVYDGILLGVKME